jgi:hypothetical protein
MSKEVISQSERRIPDRPNDSNAPAEGLVQRLRLLGDLTRLQLAHNAKQGL